MFLEEQFLQRWHFYGYYINLDPKSIYELLKAVIKFTSILVWKLVEYTINLDTKREVEYIEY